MAKSRGLGKREREIRCMESSSPVSVCLYFLLLSNTLSTSLYYSTISRSSTTLYYSLLLSTTPYYSLLLSNPLFSRIPILTSRFATSLYFFSTLYSTLSLSLRFLSLLILYPFPLRERERVCKKDRVLW